MTDCDRCGVPSDPDTKGDGVDLFYVGRGMNLCGSCCSHISEYWSGDG